MDYSFVSVIFALSLIALVFLIISYHCALKNVCSVAWNGQTNQIESN